MRTFVVAAVAVVAVALLGGCTGEGDSTDPEPDPSTSTTPSPRSGDVAVIDSAACDEVRAGIDAFNAGEFDETVKHFEAALPLAEEREDGSVLASELTEAVRYYAELEAERYPDAARSSPEFAKYKAITLGQCVAGDDETSEEPGTEV